jgi:hypothetical protein
VILVLGSLCARLTALTLQVKDRQQRLDRFRAAHVGRQDRRREPDAVGVGSVRLAIAYTRLADGDRTDTGHHLAFRQVTVAHDALVTVRSLQIGMLAEKVRNLGLDRLGQQSTRPIAQDFGELIVDVSWLNQLDDVIFGHGISLLRWRSGGVKHPHDMPPFRFPPSPTFSDSSERRVLSFKPQPRLERRDQDGQHETEKPDHRASLGDSVTSTTRTMFSVHTALKVQNQDIGMVRM